MFKIIKECKATGVEEVFEGFNTPDEASEFMLKSNFGTESDTDYNYFLQEYISEEEMKKKTVIAGGFDYLYGYACGERILVSNTMEQICAFIMKYSTLDDVQLIDIFDIPEIEVSMGFISYCQNQQFLRTLLPVLVPMQKGEKESPTFVRHAIKGEYILNKVRLESNGGQHFLMSVNFEDGYIDVCEQESDGYSTEKELMEAYPESISWEKALELAKANNWLNEEE